MILDLGLHSIFSVHHAADAGSNSVTNLSNGVVSSGRCRFIGGADEILAPMAIVMTIAISMAIILTISIRMFHFMHFMTMHLVHVTETHI